VGSDVMQDEKAAFEEQAFLLDFDLTKSNSRGREGAYADSLTKAAWRGWQARAAHERRHADSTSQIKTERA
jgi:hypothetical protein